MRPGRISWEKEGGSVRNRVKCGSRGLWGIERARLQCFHLRPWRRVEDLRVRVCEDLKQCSLRPL